MEKTKTCSIRKDLQAQRLWIIAPSALTDDEALISGPDSYQYQWKDNDNQMQILLDDAWHNVDSTDFDFDT